MLKDLYIIRHGHPLTGTGIPYDRVPGPALSEVGRAEAYVTAQFLAGRGIEVLHVSPLDRALGTGQIVSTVLHIPMVIDPELAEHRSDEKYEDVKARLRVLLARLDAEPVTCMALVTHGSPIKALLQILSLETLDLSKHSYPNGNHAPTAGVWHASRDLFDVWQLSLVFRPVVSIPTSHVAV